MNRGRPLNTQSDLEAEVSECEECDHCQHISPVIIAVIAILGTLVFVFVFHILWRRLCKRGRHHGILNRDQTVISTIRPPPYGYPGSCCRGNELVHRGRRLGNCNETYIPDHTLYSEQNRPFGSLANEAQLYNQRDHSIGRAANENAERIETQSHRQQNDSAIPVQSQSQEESCTEHDTSPMEVTCPQLFDHSLSRLMEETERSVCTKIGDKLVVYITHRVDHRGDYLILDNMGISLHIPPLAVRIGQDKLITLVLNWDLGDNPIMSDREALVSPVVYVGPHGLKLEKPCRLTYRHCSFDTRQVQVLKSETEIIEQKDWKIMCNREDDSGNCVLTQDECQLQINSFTLFTCVQSPLEGENGKKWIQLAVFANPLQSSMDHHQVRIYFLNKTSCALQWAIQNEAQFGGKLTCPEKVFLFHGNNMDAFVTLRYLCDGWQKVDEDESERVQFLSVWHGKCPHVCICFKKMRLHVNELNFQMYVNQDTLENEGEKLIIHAMENPNSSEHRPFICPRHREEIIVNQTDRRTVLDFRSDEGSSQRNLKIVVNKPETEMSLRDDSASLPDECFLPHHVKTELKYLLDPRSQLGNDWRAFAAKLGFDKCIRMLESVPSPTETLLKEMEKRRITVLRIKDVLYNIGRHDAAMVIQCHLQDRQCTSQKTPVEGSDTSGFHFNKGNR